MWGVKQTKPSPFFFFYFHSYSKSPNLLWLIRSLIRMKGEWSVAQKLRGNAHVSVHALVFTTDTRSSHDATASLIFESCPFPLNLSDCICASVCVGLLVHGLDPLWLCFYYHSLTCGKGCCYIVGFGCSILKICASPWGVHALS